MSDKAKKRRLDNTTVRALAPHSLALSLALSLTLFRLGNTRKKLASLSTLDLELLFTWQCCWNTSYTQYNREE